MNCFLNNSDERRFFQGSHKGFKLAQHKSKRHKSKQNKFEQYKSKRYSFTQHRFTKRGFPSGSSHVFGKDTWVVDLHCVLEFERNKELKTALREAKTSKAKELAIIHGWGSKSSRSEGEARRAFHKLLSSTQYNLEHIRVPQSSNGGVTLVSTSGQPYEPAGIIKGSALFINKENNCLEINGFLSLIHI